MIKAHIGKSPKILLVYETPQREWWEEQKVSAAGIQRFLKSFRDAGISLEDISVTCLCDSLEKPKASDFKPKAEYTKEFIDTYGFNLIVPIGATAFEKIAGFKGANKYAGKILESELHAGCKVLPCPNPAAAKYDPSVAETVNATIKLCKTEMEFPEIFKREVTEVDYQIIDTMEKFSKFYKHFLSGAVKEFAYDLETTGLEFNKDKILTIQFSDKENVSYLIPSDFYGKWHKDDWTQIVCSLRRLFKDDTKTVIGHNKKFDDKFMAYHWGIKVRKKNTFDTMIASFLCDENTPNGLKDLACTMTDLGDYELPLERFKDNYCKTHKMKKKDFSYDLIPFDILAPYALTDTDATIRIYNQFKVLLVQEEQTKTFGMVMRFSYLLTKMELNGWPVDLEWAVKYREKLDEAIETLSAKLQASEFVLKVSEKLKARALEAQNAKRVNKLTELKTPFEFKFNSTPHKHALFFEEMRLAVVKYTKTKNANGKFNPACDKEVIDKWIEQYPEYEDFLIEIRTLAMIKKIRSTYVDAVINRSINGRIHPTYNACGAKTGRLSSSNPNLQNVVTRADKKVTALLGFDPAKYVKKMFRAGLGKVIVGADLSAAEMRVACLVSCDAKLRAIFNAGVDIHCAIAKELFPYIPGDMPDDEIKEKYALERTIAKTVQFLTLYGGGADKLAKTAKITLERAEEIIADYFIKYPGVAAFIKDTTRFVKEYGYSLSPLGRKRRVPIAMSESKDDMKEIAQGIRQAVNAVIQSMASDGLLISACNFNDLIEEQDLPITLLGSIHDALYIEVDESFAVIANNYMIGFMEEFAVPADIPMVADSEYGVTWSDFEKFSEDALSSFIDEEEEIEEEEVAA